MTSGTIRKYSLILRLLAGGTLKASWRLTSAPLRWPLLAMQKVPQSLLFAPQDIRTADPTIAEDIYAGYFNFTGKIIKIDGQSPFEIQPPSEEWARRLHSFEWLRHLRAADTALSRMNGRALVEDWLNLTPKLPNPIIWEPEIAARRLMSWLSQSPLILESVDSNFYRRFMRAIARHTRYLRRQLGLGLSGRARLQALIALAEVALCGDDVNGLQKSSSRALMRELNRQVLRDGGHVSRNPRVLVDLMLDLLPLRQLYIARGLTPPEELQNTMDRILPMLRLFRHADGSLALFQGMAVTPPDVLATLFAYEDAQVEPIMNADMSGYQRREAGESILIMDAGPTPNGAFSMEGHASALAFEFSSGKCKIITNCGAAARHRNDFHHASRLTAAHSALVYADTSSTQFLTGRLGEYFGMRIIDGPRDIKLTSQSGAEGFSLEASHDGYRSRFNVLHRRRLTLSADGTQLSGKDEILALDGKPTSNAASSLRFHLDPATQVQRLADPASLRLILPDDQIWDFSAEHENPEIEESVLFADPSGPRRTMQIALHTSAPEIRWSLTRRVADAKTDKTDSVIDSDKPQ